MFLDWTVMSTLLTLAYRVDTIQYTLLNQFLDGLPPQYTVLTRLGVVDNQPIGSLV